MSTPITLVSHMLTELETPYKTLTRWEERFVISVRDQFDRRGTLTDKQCEVLERIYMEKTC